MKIFESARNRKYDVMKKNDEKAVKVGSLQQRVALPRISLGFNDQTKLK